MVVRDAFIGRTVELTALDDELDQVRAGKPRVAWVSGPAGIGKTSLLRRFQADVPDAMVLWASGDEIEAGLPFGVLTQLLAAVPEDLVRQRPLLAAGPEAGADPLAVGAELLGVLGALQSAGPVIVVVDDAHWSDDVSVRALVFVVRRLRRDQVLVVASVRADADVETAPWGRVLAQGHLLRRIPLDGLSSEDIVRLSTALDGPELTPAAGRRLREHTDGHPMHARALLAELSAEELVDMSGVLPAPRSLASLVLVRVAKLSPPAQELVLAASVLGARCALSDAVVLADLADPLSALGEAVAAGLLEEVPSGLRHDVVFPHLLVRAAVYADLPPVRRHALHRAAAELLGGSSSFSHRVAAAVGPDADLAGELEELGAAERVARRWHASADHLMAAAEVSATYEARSRRLVGAVESMMAGGELARALRAEADVRAAAPGAGRSRVLGQLAAMTGRFAVAREEFSAALDGGDGHDPDGSAAAAHLGLMSLIEGDPGRAVDLARSALRDTVAPDVVALARFVRVIGLAVQGGHDAAVAALSRPEGNGGPSTGAEGAAIAGVLALWSDDAVTAAATLAAVVRDAAPSIPMQGFVLVLGCLAEAQYRIGDWDAATTNAELAISLARDAGVLLGSGITHAIAGYVAAGRGSWDTARARVGAAAAAADMLPWWGSRAYAAVARATLAQAEGDHGVMREALGVFAEPEILALVDGMGALPWRALLVESLLGLGLEQEADDALRQLESRVADRSPGWSGLEAARLRAWREELRGDPEAAGEAYRRGLALADKTRAALSRARLETAYGRHLLGRGERRSAVDVLRAARERLEQLGATPFLTECDDLLRAAGLHPPPAGDVLGLTAQEIAVARSVVRGRTNQQTGAELYVTGRTVAFHLSNIYAKLGISSRRDLAARLPELLA